jgi:hypothetical protein
MNSAWKFLGTIVLVPALVVGILTGMNLLQPTSSLAQKDQGAPGSRYTVVHTEGTNIIVTDNKTNTVYYYTVDPGSEPGSDLKLRGSLDLSQIGEQVIKPKLLKKPN